MKVLAFDSSMTGCSGAVVAAGRLLARARAPGGTGQSEALMPMLARLMQEAALDWSALDLIAVTVGPGSFTGLRIGLAAARGLALAHATPVAGIGTAEALAASVPETERAGHTVLAAIESKRAELFVQDFDETLTPRSELAARLPEAVARSIRPGTLLAGDGAARLVPLTKEARATAVTLPDAEALATLAAERHAQGRALAPEPLYLRGADVTLPGR